MDTNSLVKKTQLLISGTPGCGKSTFGRWLVEKKQFTHVDMENRGLEKHGFRSSWDKFCDGNDTESFIAAIRACHSSIVLDWGFPPSSFHLVQRLNKAGVGMFWFEGDRLATRDNFIQRGTGSVSSFDSQWAQISAHWADIKTLFSNSIIKTVHTDGSRLSPDAIFMQVFKGLNAIT